MAERKYSEDLLIKASEIKQQFHTNNKVCDWMECEELLSELGYDVVCDENFRCAVKAYEKKKGLLKTREEVKTKEIENAREKLLETKFELDTKVQEFRDERNYLSRVKRPLSRTDIMCNTIKEVTSPLPYQTPYTFIKPNKRKRKMVCLLSDGQVGEMVKLPDTAGFNEYNFDIYKKRLDNYFNTIMTDCEDLKIDNIQILELGDHVEGDGNIYKSQKYYLENHVIKQVFQVADTHAMFIKGLVDNGIKQINTMAICGNHGRTGKDNHELANFDILAFDRTQLLLKDYKNINYQYSNTFMEVVNILGYNFLISHGDGMNKSTLENSFYKYAYMYNQKGINLYSMCIGHFHVPKCGDDIMSTAGDIIINGNIVGSNPLSIKNLQADNRPSQIYFIVEEGVGITYKKKCLLD